MARVVHFEIPAKDIEKVVNFYKNDIAIDFETIYNSNISNY